MELLSQEEYTEKPRENIENPVARTAMVDTSAISSIVVTNGNTGEQKMLTIDNDYYYNDLIKLYKQLDFTAECEENSKVGYQYCMMLQDADGNSLVNIVL